MGLETLATLPENVRHTDALVARLDRCWQTGFSRLGPDETDALASLRRVFTGTPLGGAVDDAVEAFGRAEFTAARFAAVAAARAALQGAMHDALLAQAAAALGRTLAGGPSPVADVPAAAVGLDGARDWLAEIALAGFARLDAGALLPFSASLDRLQETPAAARLATLLTGFHTELVDAVPVADDDEVPLRRWADLWTRAMVLTGGLPADGDGALVTGRFEPLGVALRHHRHLAQLVVLGRLDDGYARLPLSAWKVDVISGPSVFALFRADAAPLLQALAGGQALKVEDMRLRPGGDLVWGGAPAAGGAVDVFARAAAFAPGAADAPAVPPVAPLDRHPVQIAVPVTLDLPAPLPVQTPDAPWTPLNAEVLASARRVFGLLRFDAGRWWVEALAAQTKKAVVHNGAFALGNAKSKAKEDVLGILRERAGRLLRGSP